MSGFELFAIEDGESNEDSPIAIASVEAEFHQPQERLPEILNPSSPKGWGIWPRTGISTTALFVPEKLVDDVSRFRIKLHFNGNPAFPNHTLGRFRLAVTNRPRPHVAVGGDSGEDSSVGVILGSAYLSGGDATSAVDVLRETIARNNGGVAMDHLLLAWAHLRLDQIQEANDALQRAATQMHADGADETLLTVAAQTLNEAIENGLDEARWWQLRATVYERLGERAQALQDYEMALELDPTNSNLPERIALLNETVSNHWDFDFAADDWAGVDGTAIASADGHIGLHGPGDLRSMSVSSQLPEGWKVFTMRVRSPEATVGRVHLRSTSQPFDVPMSEDEWHDLRLYVNNSQGTNSLQLSFMSGEAPVEIDRITISEVNLANEADAILAQFNERVARYPEDAQVFVARARLFSELEQTDDAEADYARAHELAANDPDLIRELSEANLSFDSSVIVPPSVIWKYWHPTDGTDPAEDDPDFHETFANLDYDDAHWSSGKDSAGPGGGFGYDDQRGTAVPFEQPSETNRLTAYFRHSFETEEPREDLLLYLQRDDGVIVYLDGREVQRDNIGPGPEAYELAAQRTIGGSDEQRVMVLRLPGQLEAGQHVLSISLHNRAGGSSDLRIAEISLRGAPVTKSRKSGDSEHEE
jgi:tetratricopeptide (TPR) repeat protein